MTKLLTLLLLTIALTACTGADGKTYVVVEQDTVQKAAIDGAFLMCIGMVAQDLDAIVPALPENVAGVLGYCANEVVSLYGTEPIPEPTPVPSGDSM